MINIWYDLDHLVDDASCACGAQTENTEHFFCPLYTTISHHLNSIFELLGYINLYIILCGILDMPNHINKTILYHIHVDALLKNSIGLVLINNNIIVLYMYVY